MKLVHSFSISTVAVLAMFAGGCGERRAGEPQATSADAVRENETPVLHCTGTIDDGRGEFTAVVSTGLEISEVWGGGEELDSDRFPTIDIAYEDGLMIVKSVGASEAGLVRSAQLEISEHSSAGWLRMESTPSSAEGATVWVNCR